MGLTDRSFGRKVRKSRIRKKITGTTERPRLSVYRSLRYVYAQIIDDQKRATIVSCSSLEKDVKAKLKGTGNKDAALQVGKMTAERAKAKKIDHVVFDRNGYAFHGLVRAVAEGAREAGLRF